MKIDLLVVFCTLFNMVFSQGYNLQKEHEKLVEAEKAFSELWVMKKSIDSFPYNQI